MLVTIKNEKECINQLNNIFRKKTEKISQDIIEKAKIFAYPYRFSSDGLSSSEGWLIEPSIKGYNISPTFENERALYHNVYGADLAYRDKFLSWNQLDNYPILKLWVTQKLGEGQGVKVRGPNQYGITPSLGSPERHFLGRAYQDKLKELK